MAKKKVEASLEDMLGALNDSVEEVTPVTETKEKNRPTINSTGLMTEYAGITTALKTVEERKDIVGRELKDSLWTDFTNLWFQSKAKPSNPKVETKKNNRPDCQAIYQCRTNFKVQYREEVSGRASVIEPLRDIGFSDDQASKIFDENIEIVVETVLRPFNELAQGAWVSGEFSPATDVQKVAATKLLAFVIGKESEPLSPSERAECLVKETRYEVKSGFLERAAHYCKDANQMRALLTIIKPGEAISHIKFAQSDTDEEKNGRLEELFHGLLFGE